MSEQLKRQADLRLGYNATRYVGGQDRHASGRRQAFAGKTVKVGGRGPQLFSAVLAKNAVRSCRVLRDLHFGQAGARPPCWLIRCTTENRFPHFPHLYSYVGMANSSRKVAARNGAAWSSAASEARGGR